MSLHPLKRASRAAVGVGVGILLAGCSAKPLRPVPVSTIETALIDALADERASLMAALDRGAAWIDTRTAARLAAATQADAETEATALPPRAHARAWAAVTWLRAQLAADHRPAAIAAALRDRCDIYESIGRDGRGTVLFTGYYAPVYAAARAPTERYRYPLYTAPPDATAHTRRAIERGNLLAGRELVWLADPLDAYLAHVNGSARLRLTDGTVMDVAHSATNEHAYTSLGRLLIDAGLSRPEDMSMQTIRALHRRDPAVVEDLMRRNDRYVFFREATGEPWPRGSLGVALTAGRSIATDKRVFPAGAVALVVTEVPDEHGVRRPFVRLVLDQDTGGAITTPGRADIFMGVGDRAGAVAGRLQSTGRLYYLLMKDPE